MQSYELIVSSIIQYQLIWMTAKLHVGIYMVTANLHHQIHVRKYIYDEQKLTKNADCLTKWFACTGANECIDF